MASIKTLGLATPSGLPYAVSEGILPPDPPPKSYRWQRCGNDGEPDSLTGEELLITEDCVVWSREGIVQRVFRFGFEGEKIRHVAFARFPNLAHATRTKREFALPPEQQQQHQVAPNEQDRNLGVPQTQALFNGQQRKVDDDVSDAEQTARALLVVLKSQAHILFLSGTSHVINLPFDVGAVFALPCGVVFQRSPHIESVVATASPQIPHPPQNSFVFSQLTASSNTLDLTSSVSAAETGPASTVNASFSFTSLLPSPKAKRRKTDLPGHLFLSNPLVEPSLVYDTGQHGDADRRSNRHRRLQRLPQHEEILYLSRQSEVALPSSREETPPKVLVAVTFNRDAGRYNVWDVRETSRQPTVARGRTSLLSSGAATRRKISRMPGTGANTPGGRVPSGMRESFGGLREASQNQEIDEDALDIASQLDPAFENPGAPAKSTRRISSLLARSDLSNRDQTKFPEFAAGLGNQRGTSFGPRPSLEGMFGRMHRGHRQTAGLSPDLISSQISNVSIDGIEDTKSDDSDDALPISDPWTISNPLQTALAFKRIHSFSATESFIGSVDSGGSASLGLRIFTVRPPESDPSLARDFILCILNRDKRKLSVFYATVREARKTARSGKPASPDIKISEMRGGSDISDATKIQDAAGRSRLLVLGRAASGLDELTLQSPWSTQLVLRLPDRLLIRNLQVVDPSSPFKRKREGGLKRVLSDKIDHFQAVTAYSSQGEFDGQDPTGTWHRLSVRMSPQSPLVAKAIKFCEYVLPRTGTEREPFLRVWWDIMSWLRNRPDTTLHDEWAGFVVIMGLSFIPSLSHRQKPAVAAKRRKGGLLRSSSGANVDQEAFETMIAMEDVSGSWPSTWLQDTSWQWLTKVDAVESASTGPHRTSGSTPSQNPFSRKVTFFPDCLSLAREFAKSEAGQAAVGDHGYLPTSSGRSSETRQTLLSKTLLALHLLCEEEKLDVLASDNVYALNPLLAQLAAWLKWNDWLKDRSGCYMLSSADMERWTFDENTVQFADVSQPDREPPSIMASAAAIYQRQAAQSFPTLLDLKQAPASSLGDVEAVAALTPRTRLVFALLQIVDSPPLDYAQEFVATGYDIAAMDSFPEAISTPLRSKLAACQAQPGTTASREVLRVIGRNDIALLDEPNAVQKAYSSSAHVDLAPHDSIRDFHTISNSTLDVDAIGAYDGQAELDRLAITRSIFRDDQRCVEAGDLLHPLKPAVARCVSFPEWSEADLLEAQQELVKIIAVRTLAVSPGRGMLYYCGRSPLLTEKFPIHGFTLSCVMRPTNTTVTADRSVYTEEKVSWAFFHAGVEAGLTISKNAKGIDTSWITFNKPPELNNRHAGFLLALGLNGHLKSVAKWVAFKYLTPKHTMTSIGLLLGLAASYLGTMDPLITRLMSVHVTRMLPPGAAELNLSPLTQTTGIMAIGLLYCETQHRRMSEVMMSEMESTEHDDSVSPSEDLRDEGYRLAAGFALGYINLGRGKNLKGLNDMQIVERLLSLAIATKKVDLVHVLDKATAAATVAVALIFMKTGDKSLARKIDVPDTVHQFDYVRPDIFLLRTVARHLIMWDEITPTMTWMEQQLPAPYRPRHKLSVIHDLSTDDLPFFNIVAGLCLSIGLRFVGSAREDVRNLLGHYLDQFIRITNLPAHNYDGRLTRITARNCQDTVALAAAAVMAGTGDIWLFRRLRRLHGRTDPDTPYGSHLAAHMAIGALFLGGGTHSFATTPVAVASLLAAFYPLFPAAVLDNRAHLQAFRHLWALAAEPRCLVARAAVSQRPVSAQLAIHLRDGTSLTATAPCLLPPLDRVAAVACADPTFWPVALDLAGNSAHAAAFRRHQSLFVRRRGPADIPPALGPAGPAATFAATMRALAMRASRPERPPFEWVFDLPTLASLDRAARARALLFDPIRAASGARGGDGALAGSSVADMLRAAAGAVGHAAEADDRLALERGCLESGRAERLWSLRALLAWAEGLEAQAGKKGRVEEVVGWLGKEVLEWLRARVVLLGTGGRAV